LHEAFRSLRKDAGAGVDAVTYRDFRTLGYDQTSWQQLESDLRSLASLPAEPLESTEYGTKYAIIGPLTGLNGRVAEIVTVWIILAGEAVPRFVTAYPKD
jgi:hypothetical protein